MAGTRWAPRVRPVRLAEFRGRCDDADQGDLRHISGYRNPYLAAKSAASLDILPAGRLILGTAAGYLRSESEALGADFARRGELLDEAIAAWKATWSGDDHQGPTFGVDGHIALPLPDTPGGPPI